MFSHFQDFHRQLK